MVVGVSGVRTAIVAGGGIAGLTAACELADAGVRVTLLEKRPFLGGRAYSYRDRSGVEVDNGQHVFLGCCTQYIALLQRLGVERNAHLQKRLHVPVIDKVWGRSTLTTHNLPPPLHLLPSLLRYRSLSLPEKALAAYAFSAIRSLDRSKHPELDSLTFGEWLWEHRQGAHARRSLWNLIVQPTLNDDVSRVSADLALMVFQEGFLRSRNGANVGWAKVGLSALLGEAARRYIEARGGEVRTGVAVKGVAMEDGAVSRVALADGELTADAYVLAVPADRMLALLPGSARREPFFARARGIETSPIVNVHLWYDRPVWDGRFAAFLNTPLQWAFNKTRLWERQELGTGNRELGTGNKEVGTGPGQYIDISLSGARDFIEMPAAEISALFQKEMQALFPLARGAAVTRALVVKQRDATFAAKPGVRALRPPQRTPVRNLFLGGDWTDTGWPATMESAVRSGLAAARAAMAAGAGEGEGAGVPRPAVFRAAR